MGNDVVDLGHPRTQGKAGHARFVERVFTEQEAALISAHADPDRRLWTLWAAKEAAYKVVSRLADTPPVFAHRSFAVDLSADSADSAGSVIFEGVSLPFVVVADTPSYLHVVAWNGAATGSLPSWIHAGCATPDPAEVPSREELSDFLSAHFSTGEASQIQRVESALARLYAKRAIAEHLGVPAAQILIHTAGGADGRTPPEVEVVGSSARVALSLSHDCSHVAWSFTDEAA